MRYMLLVYGPESGINTNQVSPEELEAYMMKHQAYYGEMAERGILQVAERLRPSTSATTVRVKDGKVLVSDGPFAETKEQLAGLNIFVCKDLDEAIDLAARFPTVAAGHGCIEIRPIWEADDSMQ
jgi:hypothetical protein